MSRPRLPSSATRCPANAIKILDLLRSRSRLELCPCWRSSGAEQLPCKQWVGGSNPPASASLCAALANERFSSHAGRFGEVPKWPKGADCKSAGVRLRGFKSSPPHHCSECHEAGFDRGWAEKGAATRGTRGSAVEKGPSGSAVQKGARGSAFGRE